MGCDMMCKKCHGTKHLVMGALLLLNAFVWPRWVGFDGAKSWVSFFAVLLVLGGFVKLVMPNKCPGCASLCAPETKGKKK